MFCMQLAGETGRKNSPCGHYGTIFSGCIFATKACINNRKKLDKQQYLLHMSSQYGKLQLTSVWDWFGSLGYPSKFQQLSRLGFVTAATSLTGGQPNLALCLAMYWAGTLLCILFWGLLPPDEILPGAKFTLRPILAISTISLQLRRVLTIEKTC